LNASGARAIVVGAHAVAFHAKPRFTKDLDILVDPTPENARRVVSALAQFGFADLEVGEADLAVPDRIVQLGVPPNRVDLLTSITAVTFEEAWAGKVAGRFGAVDVYYLGKAELLRNKEAVGRPQDLVDVDWLRRA
jgi:hypothetical protein